MIGYLRGTVLVKQAGQLILETGGVGYELAVPLAVLERVHEGQEAALFVHHAVRDDGHYLYGFHTLEQRSWFRELIRVSDFSADRIADYDGILMGCPACGTEELDEGEFEPFFVEAENHLKDVKVGLFGSYGWGGGAFMDTWTERVNAAGGAMVADGVTCELEPDDDALERCRALGAAMAKAVG